MTEVKFNATGRWILTGKLDDDDSLKEKMLNYGIMDPVPFDEEELERLVEIADNVDSTNVHWLNTKMRLRTALQQ